MKVHRPPRPRAAKATASAAAPKAKPASKDGWEPGARRRPAAPPPPPVNITGLTPTFTPGTVSDARVTEPVTVNGVTISPHGCSQAAMDEAKAVVTQLTQRADLARGMEKAHVTLVIVPADTKMTDLPEFASLRGTKTFDGRLWDDVRGSGGLSQDGRVYVGVAEENLAHLPQSAYPAGYSIAMHELAHALHQHAVPHAEAQAITQAYEARHAAQGPWTEAYASSNQLEYFAQGTDAWFGKNSGVGQNGAAWLQANDPALATILEGLYGPPPAAP